MQQLADLMTERSTQGSPVDFPQHAAVDKAVREASSKAEQKLEEFDVEMRCVVNSSSWQILSFYVPENYGTIKFEVKFAQGIIQCLPFCGEAFINLNSHQ